MMEKEKLEDTLIEYIDGTINEHDKLSIEKEILKNADVRKRYDQLREVMELMHSSQLYEAPGNGREQFNRELEKEIASVYQEKTIRIRPVWYRMAAAVALLIIGGGVGYWISRQYNSADEMRALRLEMEMTRKYVISRLDDELSPGQRIIGVKAVSEMVKPDDEIMNVLIRTMNEDPNSNVRLAAINALGRFYREEKIKKALIASLYHQTDPVVQITLIEWMVVLKAKEAVRPLEKIIQDENTLPTVKDEAQAGIFKLS